MNTLFLFGDEHSRDVWLRACTYMGAGWTYLSHSRTFVLGDNRVTCLVVRSKEDIQLANLRGVFYDLIVEHASFPMHGDGWDAFVRGHLLRRT